MQIDTTIDWSHVGGLSEHVRALKEMVMFPLLYPEYFDRFNITPPRYWKNYCALCTCCLCFVENFSGPMILFDNLVASDEMGTSLYTD